MTYGATVSDLIREVQVELDLHSNTFLKLSIIARDFNRDVAMDTNPSIRTERWEIPANRIIPLPKDYVAWTKAASQYKEGLKLLAYNHKMAQGVSSANVPNAYSGPTIWTFYNTGGEGPSPYMYMYGMNGYYAGTGGRVQAFGNGDNLGYFSIDKINKVIRIDPTVSIPNFYMEYLSDCVDNNDDTMVHPFCIKALKETMKCEYLRNRRDPAYKAFETNAAVEVNEMRKRFVGDTINMATIVNLIEQEWGAAE